MSKTIRLKTKEEALQAAYAYAIKLAGFDAGERRWLVGHAPDSYGNEAYRTELHVLEGSQPQGFVVVMNGDHRIVVIDPWGSAHKDWTWVEEVQQ